MHPFASNASFALVPNTIQMPGLPLPRALLGLFSLCRFSLSNALYVLNTCFFYCQSLCTRGRASCEPSLAT